MYTIYCLCIFVHLSQFCTNRKALFSLLSHIARVVLLLILAGASLAAMWVGTANHLSTSNYIARLRHVGCTVGTEGLSIVCAFVHHLVILLAALVLWLKGWFVRTDGSGWDGASTFCRVDMQIALSWLTHVVVLLTRSMVVAVCHGLHHSVAAMADKSSRSRLLVDLSKTCWVMDHLLSAAWSDIYACISAVLHPLGVVVLHLSQLSLHLLLGLCFVHALADKNVHK